MRDTFKTGISHSFDVKKGYILLISHSFSGISHSFCQHFALYIHASLTLSIAIYDAEHEASAYYLTIFLILSHLYLYRSTRVNG